MKQKNFRRVLALLLAFALVFGLLPGSAFGLRVSADVVNSVEASAEASAGDAEVGVSEADGKEAENDASTGREKSKIEDGIDSDGKEAVKVSESENAASDLDAIAVQEEELPLTLEGDTEEVVIGGTGTADHMFLPVPTVYLSAFSEQIYTAEEIGNHSAFSALSFQITRPGRVNRIEVYLADTTQTSVDKNSLISTRDATKVYDGTTPFDQTGWRKISFDRVYLHDPEMNLAIILVEEKMTGDRIESKVFSSTSNCAFEAHNDNRKVYPEEGVNGTTNFNFNQKSNIILDIVDVDVITLTFIDGENRVQKRVASGSLFNLNDTIFSKEDQYVAGWNTKEDGTGTPYSGDMAFTEDTVLYAQWVNYPVLTLCGNDEGVEDHLIYCNPNETQKIPAKVWNRERRVLTGFNSKADGTGTAYRFEQDIKVTEDTVLYAQWVDGVQVGEINVLKTDHHPVNTFYKYGFSEQIYSADEIGDTNLITGIAYYLYSGNFVPNVEIYLADIDKIGYSDRTPVPVSDTKLVYSGTIPAGGIGWKEIAFDRGFVHDTSKNLLVLTVNLTGYANGWNEYCVNPINGVGYCNCFNGGNTQMLPGDGGETYWLNRNVVYFTGDQVETNTVTFKANDDSESSTSQPFLAETEFELNKNVFSQAGYHFVEWNTEPDGTGTSYADEAAVTFDDDVILYAQWEGSTKLILNGNAEGLEDQILFAAAGNPITIPDKVFTRNNFVLESFNTKQDGSGASYLPGGEITITEETTLYAQWAPYPVLTLASNADGVENVAISLEPGVAAVIPTDLFAPREELVVYSYNTKEDGSGTSYLPGGEITITEDTTLYAQWIHPWTIVLKGNAEGVEDQTVTWESTEDYVIPTTFEERDGYVLTGFNRNADGSGESYFFGDHVTVSEDITLYAQWTEGSQVGVIDLKKTTAEFPSYGLYDYGYSEQIYTAEEIGDANVLTGIAFYLTDEGFQQNIQVYLADTDQISPRYQRIPTSEASLVYEGLAPFDQKGWVYLNLNHAYLHDPGKNLAVIVVNTHGASEDGFMHYAVFTTDTYCTCYSYRDNNPLLPEDGFVSAYFDSARKDVIYFTGVKQEPKTITYRLNDGSEEAETQIFVPGLDANLNPNTFTREHYSFTGWNTKADGSGTAYADEATVTFEDDVTLYAQWEVITATLTLKSGVDGLDDVKITCEEGEGTLLPDDAWEREGYTLAGYNSKADGSGASYEPGTSFTVAVDTVLYAEWDMVYTPVAAVSPTEETDGNIACFLGSDGNHYDYDEETESYVYLTEKEWKLPKLVPFIDGNGEEVWVSAWPLDGTEKKLTAGSYIVNQDITYTDTLVLEGKVQIILADGKTMHMDVEAPFAIVSDHFYRQWMGVDSSVPKLDALMEIFYLCGQKEASGTLSIETTGELGIMTFVSFVTGCNLEISGNIGCAVSGMMLEADRANIKIQNAGLPTGFVSELGNVDTTENGLAMYVTQISFRDSNVSIDAVYGIGSKKSIVKNLYIEGGKTLVTATENAITAEAFSISWTEMTDSFRFSSLDVEGLTVGENQTLMADGKLYSGIYEDEALSIQDELAGKTLKPYWPFTDVKVKPGDWKFDGVRFVYEHGIMTGDADSDKDGFTTFNPKGNITRGEFITTLYRLDGEKEVEGNMPFTDVKKNKFYYTPVLWALTNEITTGTSATTFSPKDNITRQDMATLLMRFADYMGFDTSGRADIRSMPDYSRVKSYARDAMAWANYEGIITGKDIDGKKYLDPRANATRQETATILMRFMNRYMPEESKGDEYKKETLPTPVYEDEE